MAMLKAAAQCGSALLHSRTSEAAALSSSISAPSAWSSSRNNVPLHQQRSGNSRRLGVRAAAVVEEEAATPARPAAKPGTTLDANIAAREGSFEAPLVVAQASKEDPEQPTLRDALPAFDPSATADVAVVGAGPAGLVLAAELAKQGLSVVLVSPESKFVNNYGVWLDEFKDLGLEHTLDAGGCWALMPMVAAPAFRGPSPECCF